MKSANKLGLIIDYVADCFVLLVSYLGFYVKHEITFGKHHYGVGFCLFSNVLLDQDTFSNSIVLGCLHMLLL